MNQGQTDLKPWKCSILRNIFNDFARNQVNKTLTDI